MADQHNASIPAMGNTIAADIPDIKENLEFHKDVFENFVGTWSNTDATGIYPEKFSDTSTSPVIMQCKIIEIGDWNMDSDNSKNVTHGIADYTKIRSVNVVIRQDSSAQNWELNYVNPATGVHSGSIGIIGATTITLYRTDSGNFDSVSFNDTSYNRGWVMVWHTV